MKLIMELIQILGMLSLVVLLVLFIQQVIILIS